MGQWEEEYKRTPDGYKRTTRKKHPVLAIMGLLLGVALLIHTWWLGLILLGWMALAVAADRDLKKRGKK